MHNGNGHFFGMHYLWWVVLAILFVWIFILPYNIPFQRKRKETPLDILKKRFVRGEMTKEEFEEAIKTLKSKS